MTDFGLKRIATTGPDLVYTNLFEFPLFFVFHPVETVFDLKKLFSPLVDYSQLYYPFLSSECSPEFSLQK